VAPDFNLWANSENILSFIPLPSLSSIIHQVSPLPNRGGPSLFPSFTSLKIHGDLKFQTREGIKIGSKRISQGPSSQSPSSSLNSSRVLLSKGIQIFVLPDLLTWCKDLNPLVEHLLRSPRRHTYRSIRFRWTHYENPRFGVGRPSPV
jgi:hypothetical protein